MDWKQIESDWETFKASAREEWDRLSDEDVNRSGGNREELISRLQERYGQARAEAARQLDDWAQRLRR